MQTSVWGTLILWRVRVAWLRRGWVGGWERCYIEGGMVGGQTQHLVSLVWPWITGPGVSPGLVKRMGGWERCYIEGGGGGADTTPCVAAARCSSVTSMLPLDHPQPLAHWFHIHTLSLQESWEKRRGKNVPGIRNICSCKILDCSATMVSYILVVSCPTGWSLYWPWALCIDHL